jgi:pimeloyl-ACP methyl ester carboxylesterase
MRSLTTDDGVQLYYEQTGTGTPIVLAHEFAGDYRTLCRGHPAAGSGLRSKKGLQSR